MAPSLQDRDPDEGAVPQMHKLIIPLLILVFTASLALH